MGWVVVLLVVTGVITVFIVACRFSGGYIRRVTVVGIERLGYITESCLNTEDLFKSTWRVTTEDSGEFSCNTVVASALEVGESYVLRVSYDGEILNVEG